MTFAGVYYCTEHHGIANEDSDTCDFSADIVTDAECKLHPLYYDINDVRDATASSPSRLTSEEGIPVLGYVDLDADREVCPDCDKPMWQDEDGDWNHVIVDGDGNPIALTLACGL